MYLYIYIHYTHLESRNTRVYYTYWWHVMHLLSNVRWPFHACSHMSPFGHSGMFTFHIAAVVGSRSRGKTVLRVNLRYASFTPAWSRSIWSWNLVCPRESWSWRRSCWWNPEQPKELQTTDWNLVLSRPVLSLDLEQVQELRLQTLSRSPLLRCSTFAGADPEQVLITSDFWSCAGQSWSDGGWIGCEHYICW